MIPSEVSDQLIFVHESLFTNFAVVRSVFCNLDKNTVCREKIHRNKRDTKCKFRVTYEDFNEQIGDG